ncbi:DUF7093 family protein [Halalkalicoccus subterraneus]|uniref:DUF7093 family protein n=1 Tax=Halalkalicoccus subterraneus TaxID=2675002 RepID=UPI000EFB961B|nr:hypothetical protein [Halalkalicoccus subterraneus]
MSLRCSLLGHEYGESEIEREREERGNEVVISVVELERCVHCGKAKTISENTEVTQRTGSRTESIREDTPQSAEAQTGGPGIRPRPDVASPSPQADRPVDSRPRTDSHARADADPADEDTEIVDGAPADGPDGTERDSGAWPDVEDARGGDGSSGWPETDGEDEGFDAEAPDGKTDLEFGGGLTPQTDQGAEIIDSSGGSSTDAGDTEPTFVSAGPRPAPDRPPESASETTLFCPNCGTSGLDDRESLRAGDICPECHKGYLSEGER